ncbi:hypothetical protein GYMLUDRAFT_182320 [Collybiopsis luxurians FD-317 M1]|uniref:Uncharacterized protein n=1 Tax=Collybiopsis luxurians FD-317 M1 TaxID=944289 RepID=A0A0D0BZC7_9AGAR|nr:hypothetical protein GYMLUDRAFT_182320 [Collybiopsis luxurians FD-317 M1]
MEKSPTISIPSTLFQKVSVDIMFMPPARGYQYIVAAHDDLSGTCKARALKQATSQALSKFFWEQIYCRYGHFILRESLIKACEDQIQDWPLKLPEAVFADRVTISKVTGFSPYQLLHATKPLMPFDLFKATFLIEGFYSGMTTTELLSKRIRQIEKHTSDIEKAAEILRKSRFKSKIQFERRFQKRLIKSEYKKGEYVLVRNARHDQEIGGKERSQYWGPFVVKEHT